MLLRCRDDVAAFERQTCADARFAADGYGKASYTTIDYSPGKRGQAELGHQ